MEGLSEGLIRFYSSQAELLFAQYENINQLLGPTNDWTHPGTHCEILLREFLRRHLLPGMSVDKGFIYGRVERDGKDQHGPEIDLLIHDTTSYRPVFRLEDFVIVQPEAVLGMIQVKRTFHFGKGQSLAEGIRQAVMAKQHYLDVSVQARVAKETALYDRDPAQVARFVCKYAETEDLKKVFSAVVSFEDETGKDPEKYRQLLLEAYREHQRYVHPDGYYDTAVYVLPHYVGSLRHLSLYSPRENIHKRQFVAYESLHDQVNVGLQLLLAALTQTIFNLDKAQPPFAFPAHMKPVQEFEVPRPEESMHKQTPVAPNTTAQAT